jgi:hypothetical protein
VSSGTSYNGWPANSDPAAIGVDKSFDVNGVTFPGGVKANDVSTVLGYVFTQLDERVEEAVPGWCWGWTYKQNVNNPSQLSNHASATAGDYNAPYHPNGGAQYEGWSPAEVDEVRRILAEVDGVIRWGADYSGTKDSMHFEINCDPATLAGVADRLRHKEDDDMGLTADDREWISGEFNRQLSKVQSVSTDDEAADGNPNTYTIAGGIGRAIRLSSFAATGQVLKPH